MKKILTSVLSILLVLMLSVSLVGCWQSPPPETSGNKTDSLITAQSVTIKATDDADRKLMSRVEAVKKVRGSSVMVKIVDATGAQSNGSAVIVDVSKDGENNPNIVYILTCAHMMIENTDITLTLPDENFRYDNNDYTFTGKIGNKIYDNAVSLVGSYAESDVAVLKLDLSKPALSGNKLSLDKICKAKVMDTSKYEVMVGEDVFAVGNPSGTLPGTVSAGIVSYHNRPTTLETGINLTLMQIDVQTNPGSSGGGLYNYYGELVGITNSGSTEEDGLNFAIPLVVDGTSADKGVMNVAKQLIGTATSYNYGYISGEWKLGVYITENNNRVYIMDIVVGGASDGTDLKKNDIVNAIKVNGTTYSVKTNAEFSAAMDQAKKVLKLGDSLIINVTHPGSISATDVVIPIEQFVFCDTGV